MKRSNIIKAEADLAEFMRNAQADSDASRLIIAAMACVVVVNVVCSEFSFQAFLVLVAAMIAMLFFFDLYGGEFE